MINYPEKAVYTYDDLVDILRILRAPGGCPWDREQTHESNRRNFLEEAYEAAEAFDLDDPELMKEELGDVLMQVLFNIHMEEEAGRFTTDDVTDHVVRWPFSCRLSASQFTRTSSLVSAAAVPKTWGWRKMSFLQM